MHGIITFLFLAAAGLLIGFFYDVAAADLGLAPKVEGLPEGGAALEFGSYATGVIAGLSLGYLANLRWRQYPVRLKRFLVSKKHIYKFTAVAAACLAVLVYL